MALKDDSDAIKGLVDTAVSRNLAAQSIKHFRLVVKRVIKSHRYKDEESKWRRPVIDGDEGYIDALVVDQGKQRTPAFTGEQGTKIVAEAQKQMPNPCPGPPDSSIFQKVDFQILDVDPDPSPLQGKTAPIGRLPESRVL